MYKFEIYGYTYNLCIYFSKLCCLLEQVLLKEQHNWEGGITKV